MAESPRDKIVSDLRKEKERLSGAVQEAREKAKELEAELKSVQSALTALTGESKRAPKSKPVEDTAAPAPNDEAKPAPKRKKKTAQGGKASKATSDDN